MARKFPKSKSLERKAGNESPKWKIFVICEGEVTEPQYFEDFKREFGSQLVQVKVIEKGGGVKGVVEKTKQLRDELIEAAAKSESSFDALFRVWGVPDVDEHPNLAGAMEMARVNNLNIALSNPCFELWALLHFAPQNKPLHRKAAQKELRKVMPKYHHEKNPIFDFGMLKSRYEDAVANAKHGMKARYEEDVPKGNPSSNVFELTEEIRNGPAQESDKKS